MRRMTLLPLVMLALAAPAEAAPPPLDGLYPGSCVRDDDQSGSGDASCALVTPLLESVNSLTVSPDGTSLYATAQNTSAVSIFRRATNGTLTYQGCVEDANTPTGQCTQTASGLINTVEIQISRDGTSLYLASFGGSLTAWSRAADGSLTLRQCFGPSAGCAAVPGLSQPESLGLSPDDGNLYVATRVGAVVRFSRAADGTLTPQDCVEDVNVTLGCGSSTQGLEFASDLKVSPDGRNLYVGSSENALVLFSRATTGALAAMGCIENAGGSDIIACADVTGMGDNPDGMSIPPDGRHLYAAVDNHVQIFTRDATGALTAAGCIKDPSSADTCATTADGLSLPNATVAADDGALYTISDGGVVALRRLAGGGLEPINCLKGTGTPSNCPEAPGLSGDGYALAADPGGINVYASTFGAFAVLKRERPPICSGATVTVPAGAPTTLSLGCSDPNEDPLVHSIVSGPSHGQVDQVNDAGGTLLYTPVRGYLGADAIQVGAGDGTLASTPGTISITVVDAARPDSNIKRIKRRTPSDRLKRFRGTASDDAALRSVAVALVRREDGAKAASASGRTLPWSDSLKRAKPRRGSGAPGNFLKAKGKARWSFKLKRPLPAGRYVLYSRATDSTGKRERGFSRRDRNRVAFQVLP